MIEDKTDRELQKIYQEVLDQLAKKYKVPSIPVYLVEKVDDTDNVGGMFFGDEWKIEVSKTQGSAHVILHEFLHYILKLVGIANGLDEYLTQWAVIGIKSDLTNIKTNEKMLNVLIDADKKIDGLNKSD